MLPDTKNKNAVDTGPTLNQSRIVGKLYILSRWCHQSGSFTKLPHNNSVCRGHRLLHGQKDNTGGALVLETYTCAYKRYHNRAHWQATGRRDIQPASCERRKNISQKSIMMTRTSPLEESLQIGSTPSVFRVRKHPEESNPGQPRSKIQVRQP